MLGTIYSFDTNPFNPENNFIFVDIIAVLIL